MSGVATLIKEPLYVFIFTPKLMNQICHQDTYIRRKVMFANIVGKMSVPYMMTLDVVDFVDV